MQSERRFSRPTSVIQLLKPAAAASKRPQRPLSTIFAPSTVTNTNSSNRNSSMMPLPDINTIRGNRNGTNFGSLSIADRRTGVMDKKRRLLTPDTFTVGPSTNRGSIAMSYPQLAESMKAIEPLASSPLSEGRMGSPPLGGRMTSPPLEVRMPMTDRSQVVSELMEALPESPRFTKAPVDQQDEWDAIQQQLQNNEAELALVMKMQQAILSPKSEHAPLAPARSMPSTEREAHR